MYDPRKLDAWQSVTTGIHETQREAWERQQAYLVGKHIGEPKATSTYTIGELRAMSMVGIYTDDQPASGTSPVDDNLPCPTCGSDIFATSASVGAEKARQYARKGMTPPVEHHLLLKGGGRRLPAGSELFCSSSEDHWLGWKLQADGAGCKLIRVAAESAMDEEEA